MLDEIKKKNEEMVKSRFKNFSPEKKLELAMNLYYTARELKRAGLKLQHPDWTDEEIDKKLFEIFLYARS
jgi:capsid portal protein